MLRVPVGRGRPKTRRNTLEHAGTRWNTLEHAGASTTEERVHFKLTLRVIQASIPEVFMQMSRPALPSSCPLSLTLPLPSPSLLPRTLSLLPRTPSRLPGPRSLKPRPAGAAAASGAGGAAARPPGAHAGSHGHSGTAVG